VTVLFEVSLFGLAQTFFFSFCIFLFAWYTAFRQKVGETSADEKLCSRKSGPKFTKIP